VAAFQQVIPFHLSEHDDVGVGKIQYVREYLDSGLVTKVFGRG